MRISELARRSGVSARSLRHYDRHGLLNATRLPNGYRDFTEQSVEQVRRIRSLLGVGLSLAGVAALLPCFADDGRLAGCDRARARLVDQIAALDESLAAMARTRAMLAEELARWAEPGDPGPGSGGADLE
ncbi:MerR family transcriptional regulator [Kitasatospora sp. RB6PN24]|uniref:MerR family transcriptional regulator n=1 Tax=Kitasatospora humi TaxID=2893891 RepID=UPI001E5F462E|nr:MerR family transcriptional regulator [Kitasatospora humi]MCC9308624.1 MerR family transcriptional regulator [Kitasatospora humi]